MKRWALTISLLCMYTLLAAQRSDMPECKYYYCSYSPNDTNHFVFKEVTVKSYFTYDSLLNNKRYIQTYTSTFNKKGFRLFSKTVDSTGKVTDSLRNRYDSKGRRIYSATYELNDSDVMRRTYFEIWVYDNHGNIIKDSIVKPRNRWRSDDTNNTMSVEYKKYDTANNVVVDMTVQTANNEWRSEDYEQEHTLDTDITWSRYDKHNNLVYSLEIDNGDTTKEYNTYNDKEMQVFHAHVTSYDSEYDKTTYNEKGYVLTEENYKHGKLTTAANFVYALNGNVTETFEELSTADQYSCPNNSVTVTVSDSNDRQLSKVITKEKDGQPFITTIIDKYVFDHGRVIADTTYSIEKGFMYTEMETSISVYGFDKNGNEILNMSTGGDPSKSDSKEKWVYNEYNNLLSDMQYSSCQSDIVESETLDTYYPDGKSIKEVYTNRGGISHDFYDKNARETEYYHVSYMNDFSGNEHEYYRVMIYQYKN